MPEKITDEDLELLGELGMDVEPEQTGGLTAKEQRIIAGFEEIERFAQEHGRPPGHGEERDIFERIYAVRLDRLRESAECREVLKGRDTLGLLGDVGTTRDAGVSFHEDPPAFGAKTRGEAEPSDDELLAALGVEPDIGQGDIFDLKHVRSRDEIRAAEEVAQRNTCKDFDNFRPIFEEVQADIKSGKRRTLKYQDNAEVKKGDLFILDGQRVIVADMGEPFVTEYGRPDRRLRVVYDNETESDLLLRSLQRALNKDQTSRRITDPDTGPLFSGEEDEDDMPAGYIYVLRSKSDHPFIAEHRTVLHKIGVTSGDVKRRIANAKKDPTFLLAEVEIVGVFKLSNINRALFEALLHKFFSSARLDMELKDRFGGQVEPQEWFLVPLPAIEAAVEKIKSGSLDRYQYDPAVAALVEVG